MRKKKEPKPLHPVAKSLLENPGLTVAVGGVVVAGLVSDRAGSLLRLPVEAAWRGANVALRRYRDDSAAKFARMRDLAVASAPVLEPVPEAPTPPVVVEMERSEPVQDAPQGAEAPTVSAAALQLIEASGPNSVERQRALAWALGQPLHELPEMGGYYWKLAGELLTKPLDRPAFGATGVPSPVFVPPPPSFVPTRESESDLLDRLKREAADLVRQGGFRLVGGKPVPTNDRFAVWLHEQIPAWTRGVVEGTIIGAIQGAGFATGVITGADPARIHDLEQAYTSTLVGAVQNDTRQRALSNAERIQTANPEWFQPEAESVWKARYRERQRREKFFRWPPDESVEVLSAKYNPGGVSERRNVRRKNFRLTIFSNLPGYRFE